MVRWKSFLFIILITVLLNVTGCDLLDEIIDETSSTDHQAVTLIPELEQTEHFRHGALEHILEGELNYRGQAVGFHYDRLPTKKGEIIDNTKSKSNEHGIYEAKVIVSNVEKTSNRGMSTFFPDEWDTQDVIDAINEAYETKTYISGNTFEGLTTEGIVIRMYLDDDEKIISAFPIY